MADEQERAERRRKPPTTTRTRAAKQPPCCMGIVDVDEVHEMLAIGRELRDSGVLYALRDLKTMHANGTMALLAKRGEQWRDEDAVARTIDRAMSRAKSWGEIIKILWPLAAGACVGVWTYLQSTGRGVPPLPK